MRFGISSHKNRILDKEVHPQSFAAHILLKREYRKQEIAAWLTFREHILNEREHVCHYCHQPVKEDGAKKLRITLDHVIPVSKGGKETDEGNVVIACYGCNQRKADKIL